MLGASAENFDLVLPAAPNSVAKARHALGAYAERCGWSDLWPIKLAVSEAVGNAVVHAYPDGGAERHVRIHATCESDRLLVTVEDDGVGMRARIDSPGLGLGMPLIQSLTDRLVMRERPESGLRLELCFAGRSNPAACAGT